MAKRKPVKKESKDWKGFFIASFVFDIIGLIFGLISLKDFSLLSLSLPALVFAFVFGIFYVFKKKDKKKIIFASIVIVAPLVICGLVLLLLFFLMPCYGCGHPYQEDTQRRQDYANLATSIAAYMTNHNGILPEDGILDAPSFISSDGNDPDGKPYEILVTSLTSEEQKIGVDDIGEKIYVIKHAQCNEETVVYKSGIRNFVILAKLKKGVAYCQEY